MDYGSKAVQLSVVVAVSECGPTLARCITQLGRELAHTPSEILITSGLALSQLHSSCPNVRDVRFIRALPDADVPKLWQLGIEASMGRIIVLLTESCIVGSNWATRILDAHVKDGPVVGGAIELDSSAGLIDSAIYFTRYSRYLPPFRVPHLDDLPGINCAYKASALADFTGDMADGFWETFIHHEMRARGALLACDASIVVSYARSIPARRFFRDRFYHGRYFAMRRSRSMSWRGKILRVLSSPAVPLVMLSRIARNAWRRPGHRRRFLACTPLMILILATWSLGECVGYLSDMPVRQLSNKDQTRYVDSRP